MKGGFLFQWDGESMVPASQMWAERCDKHFVVGERYRLDEFQHRSSASHNHYFACINEAWKNLPDDLAQTYPTPESLRKRALIRAGYADESVVVADSEEQAERMAALVRTMDEFAVVIVKGNVVKTYRAQSQDHRHMDKDTFAKSKEAVLAELAKLIGVKSEELKQNTGKAA